MPYETNRCHMNQTGYKWMNTLDTVASVVLTFLANYLLIRQSYCFTFTYHNLYQLLLCPCEHS